MRRAVLLAALRVGAAALGAALLACGPASEPRSAPPGAWVGGEAAVLSTLLERLETLEGTRLAREAARLRQGLPDCPWVSASDPEGALGAALRRLRCAEPGAGGPDPGAWLGSDPLGFRLPLDAGSTALRGSLREDGNDLWLRLTLPTSGLGGALDLLVPGDAPPGPGVLARDEALIHARLRPEAGLDLGALIPEGGQADRLFRMKSELFSGLVLDGSWEAAVYLPEAGRAMPDAALAVGFSQRAAAVAAMEGFVADLREAWPVRRSFFAVGDAEGACLLDLSVLPELAPCYVAGQRALVIGWNPASLRRALSAGAAHGPAEPLVVDLAGVERADARLASDETASALRWPWRRVSAAARHEAERIEVRVRLEGAPGGDT